MTRKIRRLSLTLLCCFFLLILGRAQPNNNLNTGIDPVEPFKIAGNIYYVGSSDVTSYLIVTPKGNIIIDSGPVEMVPQVKASVAKLGFKLTDTRLILNSHAHFDHAGGIAELRRLTGAKFIASELDSPLLGRGGLDDPNFEDRFPFEAVLPDETFRDGRKIRLGNAVLTANVTPGHTKGCTTWTTTTEEAGKQFRVIFVCSVSSPGYKLVGNARHANIVSDYRKSFAWFKNAKVEIFLGSHAGFFDLAGKAKRLGAPATANPFIDPDGYLEFISRNEQLFEEKLKLQSRANK